MEVEHPTSKDYVNRRNSPLNDGILKFHFRIHDNDLTAVANVFLVPKLPFIRAEIGFCQKHAKLTGCVMALPLSSACFQFKWSDIHLGEFYRVPCQEPQQSKLSPEEGGFLAPKKCWLLTVNVKNKGYMDFWAEHLVPCVLFPVWATLNCCLCFHYRFFFSHFVSEGNVVIGIGCRRNSPQEGLT